MMGGTLLQFKKEVNSLTATEICGTFLFIYPVNTLVGILSLSK